MLKEANVGVSLQPNVYGDFLCTNFTCLTKLFEYGNMFYSKNQAISLLTMFKSCSISFCLFWMLYNNRVDWLFDLKTHQLFHLLWCMIHPTLYSIRIDHKKIKPLHFRNEMLKLIFIAFIESSWLFYYSQSKETIIFNLILQINLYLFFIDMNKESFLIQLINFSLFYLFYGFSSIFVSFSYYFILLLVNYIL